MGGFGLGPGGGPHYKYPEGPGMGGGNGGYFKVYGGQGATNQYFENRIRDLESELIDIKNILKDKLGLSF